MTEPIASAARRIVRRRAAEFLASAQRAIARGRNAELHGARITGKRLRYDVEFFASQLGADSETVLGLLALIQDRFGAIADAETLERTLAEMLADLAEDDPRASAVRALVRANRARRAGAIASLASLWRGDDHSAYPDMLAASLSSALVSGSSKPE